MKWLIPLTDLILYSNLWIACCALSMVLQTQLVLSAQLSLTPLSCLVFFATLFIYALHRIMGIRKVDEFIEDFERYRVIAKFRHHIVVYAILAAIGGLISYYYTSFPVKIALLGPGIISLAYVLPVIRGAGRLRDINHLKIYLIALVWAFVTVVLPGLDRGELGRPGLWLMAAEKAVFIFAITLPFDIRDLKVDTHSSVKTIPALMGARNTKLLAVAMIFLCELLCWLNFQQSLYSFRIFAGLSGSYLLTASIIWFSDRVRHDYFFTGLIDGTILLQLILILLLG